METLKAISTRRSIRKYLPKKISEEDVMKLLKAAMCAPSARDEQPCEFIVINDKEVLKKIPEVSRYSQMAKDCGVAILVCGNLKLKKMEEDFWVQDCAAAIENILLAVTDLGLGAVWTAAYPWMDRVSGYQKLLNIPSDVVPVALICIGYPDEEPLQKDNFKKEKIHFNQW